MQEQLVPPESYGERKLNEMLEYATDRLMPGPGYSLELEGVDVPLLTLKELEALFGVSLEKSEGASIKLFFDGNDSFQLDNLSMQVKGQTGRAFLQRTNTLGFVPHVNMNMYDGQYTKSTFLSYDEGGRLLDALGIDIKPPTEDTVGYALWRSQLLSNTRGWHALERVEIPTGITSIAIDHEEDDGQDIITTASSVTISNEEILKSDSNELLKTKRIARSIIVFDEAKKISKKINAIIESVGDPSSRQLRMYNESSTTTKDAFVANDTEQINHIPESITLDRNTFESFRSLIEEAIELQTSD